MTSHTPPPTPKPSSNNSLEDLLRLLHKETQENQTLAQELKLARETNRSYLEALANRDSLIQGYIATIQGLRAGEGEKA